MRGRLGVFFCIAASTTRSSSGFVRNFSKASSIIMQRNVSTSSASEEGDQSWRSLLEVSIAKSRKIRGSNYVQISTVEDGEPRCRTVVFRGFQKTPPDHALFHEVDGKPCLFKMCTDKRSKKVAQHANQAVAEIVWWFPKSSEQYRVRGNLILVGDDSDDDRTLTIARKELWGNISDPARESFLSQVVPGEAFEPDTSVIPVGGRDDDGKVVPPPNNFLLMLLDPTNVDYLKLTGDQYRQVDARGPSAWSKQRVNP